MRAVLFPWPDCHNVDLIHSCEGPVLLLAVNSLWAGQHDRDYEVIIFPSAPNCCLAALLALSVLHTSDIYFKPSCCHYGIKVVSRHYHWELTQTLHHHNLPDVPMHILCSGKTCEAWVSLALL